MRRGVNNGTDALETISAAASAIASAEAHGAHASSLQKRRWRSFWSLYWCFRPNNNKRIGHAVLVTETSSSDTAYTPTAERPFQPPSIVLPFTAPPSSPASFIPSEPPSSTQSPTGLLSLSSPSGNIYSPSGPASIFAIGPYAHETQLVSPPVFSTFTTEPSTAPYTPPPEFSAHLTTPSSPEVPFARLLEPNQRYPLSQYEFQSYQLQPGSPVSHLISPCSGISGSGASSPFLDRDFAAVHPFFLEFGGGNPPRRDQWESCQESGVVTPTDAVGPRSRDSCVLLNRQNSDISPLPDNCTGLENDVAAIDHRVSFEITAEKVIRCVEKKSLETAQESVGKKPIELINREEDQTEIVNEKRHQKNRTITLGSTKEFNFEGGNCDEPCVDSSEWWVNEKKVPKEGGGSSENWSFFPILQPGVS
ncbi:hypothetical protein ABFS82_05G104200 [Erythranthe guttata]|uniref:Hydroxyproline-rich glycoprotein family protein n=1 Tax=Erythranthe guttata TaxID=4155 RepID=A0A022RHG9_ERYGU|nr:PREDICTED: COPII coat assembly protein sec16 [Erythranthe guttata]EYU38335.1 hypothetical protein MIMGU_mgv1a007082mg [Erythranthe guttata]|eukprot:XP_012836270.1 PREDICTED: COPII coat assembly protein sec16 [Erythranthe guttata]